MWDELSLNLLRCNIVSEYSSANSFVKNGVTPRLLNMHASWEFPILPYSGWKSVSKILQSTPSKSSLHALAVMFRIFSEIQRRKELLPIGIAAKPSRYCLGFRLCHRSLTWGASPLNSEVLLRVSLQELQKARESNQAHF